ncbi:MAG: DUF262 domain-containing HNH endonuclease family protein [Anaerolineae bacterium]|nr:DUF262 domain-containing HNH endonuclease family protein [Candidatus Roseilinea sp.]MDW8448368.1 DUF262 domain-containing HNH endonuclease family protein [Anaerolineae bacterium]
MSRVNVLSTRTVNYLELVGNGKRYFVPPYQRDYSWTEEQWEDLWNDIVDLLPNPDDRHYMGALVVQGESDRDFCIIDGQQRMATLSILSLAVIHRLNALADEGVDPVANRERAKELRNRFIGERDPASLIEVSRLTLNENDNGFYQDYLVQLRPPLNPRSLSRSNRLLWDCFKYFEARIGNLRSINRDGAALARMLAETVARQLLFILITVDDELNAYTVFETLNARGLELTTTDLLKNYLFSRVKTPSDREALQRRWRSLLTAVAPERFPEFLRYHLLCEQPKVRSQRLFKLVREQVADSVGVFKLMGTLEARAELFAALSDPNHHYWLERSEAKPFVRELNLFRVQQMTPLLFATWELFSPEDFIRILKLVSVISFRYSVVGRLNPNELEQEYHRAAKAVLDRTAARPAAVFEVLKPIYVNDEKFFSDFANLVIDTGGQRRKLAKYILAKLESDLSGRHCDPETDPSTIEHILPENPSEEWEQMFPRAHWESQVYRLGNLTLLESSANRRVGNAIYEEKLNAYRGSAYQLTRGIAEIAPEQWTPELLDKRQRQMAERAVHIWRADFA